MISAHFEGPEGKIVYSFDLLPNQTISFVSLENSKIQSEYKLWLEESLVGMDIAFKRGEILDRFVANFPLASLKDIQLIDYILKEMLYQTHKRFEVEGVESKETSRSFRWHGQAHSYWSAEVQKGLDLWNKRVNKYPNLIVKKFEQGKVTIGVEGKLTGDQEWELSGELSDYLSEGFPEPLVVFLDFAHS